MTKVKKSPSGHVRILLWSGIATVVIVGSLVAFVAFAFRTYYIPAASMVPTLEVHDVVLVSKIAYNSSAPRDGDIVTFDPPVESTNRFIKRIIGVPGDTLRIHEGIVFRNGTAVKEPYTAQQTAYEAEVKNYGIYIDGTPLDPIQANIPPKEKWTSPNTIPPGCYFMMGDNRNDSEDSHMWGFAQRDGLFYSGQLSGQPVGSFEQAVSIISPASRAHGL